MVRLIANTIMALKVANMFQFQNGSINSGAVMNMQNSLNCFNSKMVRLIV